MEIDYEVKKSVWELEVYITAKTSTVDLLDKFEGIGTDTTYERLVIKNAMRIYRESYSETISLVVERSKNCAYEGEIMFTKLKQGYILELKKFIESQISKNDFVSYKNSGKMFRFSKPYLLRAKNSRNRSGYRERTNYVFIGAYIGHR